MGWFACVSGEKDPETWRDIFNNVLDSVKEDEYIWLVDCHI